LAVSPAAASYRASGLVPWPETDMPTALRDVRSQGQSGKHSLALSFSGFDPLQKSARGTSLHRGPT
jgi:hypothetical protein